MADWSTRQLCLDDLQAAYDAAEDYKNDSTPHRSLAITYKDQLPAGSTRNCLTEIIWAVNLLYSALSSIIGENFTEAHQYNLPYFLEQYTGGNGDPISWEDIVAAWAEAPLEGRMFTVLSIDTMRKQIWNEPVSSFELAGGGGFGL